MCTPELCRVGGVCTEYCEYGFEVAGYGFAGTTLDAFRETCAIRDDDEVDSLMVASHAEVGT